jgi:hypothetical protein
MRTVLRTTAALVLLLAPVPAARAQERGPAPFKQVIGFWVWGTDQVNRGGPSLAFSDSGRYVSVGGAVCRVDGEFHHLGPVFRDRTQEAFRLAFDGPAEEPRGSRPPRVLALGRGLTRWAVHGAGSADALPFAFWDAKPAINPTFDPLDLPADLARLDCRQGALAVTPNGRHVIASVRQRVEKRSLETGQVAADAQTGTTVRRIFPLGTDGPFLLWSPEEREPMRTWDGASITVDAFTEPPSPVAGRSRSNPRLPPAVAPDGRTALELVDLGDSGKRWLYVWDLAQRRVIRTVPGFKDATAITCLASGNGGYAGYAVGYRTGRIEVRDSAHQVTEVVAPGAAVPDSGSAVNHVAEMATGGPGSARLAVYNPNGELVLYERGGALVQPPPTVPEFPARIGARWVYKYTVGGREDGEMVFEVGGVDVVGTDPCVRVDRFHWRDGRVKYQPSGLLMAYRRDGLYWVGTVKKGIEHTEYDRFLNPPVLTLPTDRAKTDLEYSSAYSRSPVEIRQRLRQETVDVPYRAGIAAVRVDRNTSDGPTRTESIWFAKGLGIVRWQDATNNTLLELKDYVDGK